MKTIVIANQKGGSLKTSSALNIADVLRRRGKKVLFCDLDPQANSTSIYQAEMEETNTIYDVLLKECLAKEAVQHTEMGDIIPGDHILSTQESFFQSQPDGFFKFKQTIKPLNDSYDFCIVDTPPNLGIYMGSGLNAADGVIIPISASKFSFDGLALMMKTINNIKETINPELEIYGVFLTLFDRRTTLDNDTFKMLPKIAESFNIPSFKTPISVCQSVKEAQGRQMSLYDFAPKSTAAVDYENLVDELLKKLRK